MTELSVSPIGFCRCTAANVDVVVDVVDAGEKACTFRDPITSTRRNRLRSIIAHRPTKPAVDNAVPVVVVMLADCSMTLRSSVVVMFWMDCDGWTVMGGL